MSTTNGLNLPDTVIVGTLTREQADDVERVTPRRGFRLDHDEHRAWRVSWRFHDTGGQRVCSLTSATGRSSALLYALYYYLLLVRARALRTLRHGR